MAKDRSARSLRDSTDKALPQRGRSPTGSASELVLIGPAAFRELTELLADLGLADRVELRVAVARDVAATGTGEWKEIALPFLAGRLPQGALGLSQFREESALLPTLHGHAHVAEYSVLAATAESAARADLLLSRGAALMRLVGASTVDIQRAPFAFSVRALHWPLLLFDLSDPKEARRLTAYLYNFDPNSHAEAVPSEHLADARQMCCELAYLTRLANGKSVRVEYHPENESLAAFESVEWIGALERRSVGITLARFESLVYSSRMAIETLQRSLRARAPSRTADSDQLQSHQEEHHVQKGLMRPSIAELCDAAPMHPTTLLHYRRQAGLDTSPRGGQARALRFSATEVDRLIEAVLPGPNGVTYAANWRKWSSQPSADAAKHARS